MYNNETKYLDKSTGQILDSIPSDQLIPELYDKITYLEKRVKELENQLKDKQGNYELTIDRITTSRWRFSNLNGFLGEMTFNKNGKIETYNNNNERFWKYENGLFTILNKDKKPSCKFVTKFLDGKGKWKL